MHVPFVLPFAFSLPPAALALLNLGLYFAQQLGVVLGVGAESVFLVWFLLSIRDRTIDPQEKSFGKAARGVLFVGLFLIVISGLAITGLEYMGGHAATVLAPAYLFKCLLIGIALLLTFTLRGRSLMQGILEGLVGGTWYALFVVHVLAPAAGWAQLLEVYGIWLAGFMLLWILVVLSVRESKRTLALKAAGMEPSGSLRPADSEKKKFALPLPKLFGGAAAPAPKTVQDPFMPQVPMPEAAVPALDMPQVDVAAQTLAPEPALSHVRVMPRSAEELQGGTARP